MHVPTLSILVIASLLLVPAVAAGPADAVPERCVGVHPASDLGLDACADLRDSCTVRVVYTDKAGATTLLCA